MRPGLVLASVLVAGILAAGAFAAAPKTEDKTNVKAVPILIVPILAQSPGLDTAPENARLKAALAKESQFTLLSLAAKDGCPPLDRQACLLLARKQKALEVFTGTISRDEKGTITRHFFRYSFDLLKDAHTYWNQPAELNISPEKMLAVQLDILLGRAKTQALGVADPLPPKAPKPQPQKEPTPEKAEGAN